MSREALTTILGRAALDTTYLVKLCHDPKAAVADAKLDLTAEEFQALTEVDFEALAEFNQKISQKRLAAIFDKKDN